MYTANLPTPRSARRRRPVCPRLQPPRYGRRISGRR